MRVKIDRVEAGKLKLLTNGLRGPVEYESKDVELAIWFTVENMSKVKKLEYQRWQVLAFGDRAVRLKDEHGNSYRLIGHDWIKGGHEHGTATINPGEPAVSDAVAFQRPVSAATELRLSAPSPVEGAEAGMHEFRIPASAWR